MDERSDCFGKQDEEKPASMHPIQPALWRLGGLTQDGTAQPVSRDKILRRERGQGSFNSLTRARLATMPVNTQPAIICDDYTYCTYMHIVTCNL